MAEWPRDGGGVVSGESGAHNGKGQSERCAAEKRVYGGDVDPRASKCRVENAE